MDYSEFEDMIASIAWKYSKDKDSIQDLISIGNEAFVKASMHFNGIEECQSTFLYRVVNNAMIDYLRKGIVRKTNIPQNIEEEWQIQDPSLNIENEIIFLSGLEDLSINTRSMVQDLFLEPLQLFKRTTYLGKRFLKKAFKQLMLDYGYKKGDIEFAVKELQNHLKEN